MTAELQGVDELDRELLRAALEKALPGGIKGFRVVGDRSRLYSQIWDIEVETDRGEAAYVVKDAGGRAARQAALIQEAARLFSAVPNVFIPGAVVLDQPGLLLLERFPGRSLAHVHL